LLEVQNLQVSFTLNTDAAADRRSQVTTVRAVDDVSFRLDAGSIMGLVGESGCGKSVTALSLMRLLPQPTGRITGGRILFKGQDLAACSPREMAKNRGNRMSMIFQEPMSALNPVQTIGAQLAEVFELHRPQLTLSQIRSASCELLEQVSIPDPVNKLRDYPHQLSGGMRQRVMIAMALACEPDVLIADEPTTALDVTIQAQILDCIRSLQQRKGMAVLFITHALGVVADLCDTVAVMYAGKIVESASVESLFSQPQHPYTRGLLRSIPRLDGARKVALPVIPGNVPGLTELPAGCRFSTRCDVYRKAREGDCAGNAAAEWSVACAQRHPELIKEAGAPNAAAPQALPHFVACHALSRQQASLEVRS
jgi:peptide/nickel transport system ATP-binding protein